jgi:hypothetical protein
VHLMAKTSIGKFSMPFERLKEAILGGSREQNNEQLVRNNTATRDKETTTRKSSVIAWRAALLLPGLHRGGALELVEGGKRAAHELDTRR